MSVETIGDEIASLVPEMTSIVHDLRNPLSTIHGGAELLIGSQLSEPQVHRIARNMYGASVHMKELLDEFVSRYRGTGDTIECAGLRGLVAAAVDKVAVLAESQSVQIAQGVPGNLEITADRRRIQRVFVNLLLNALDVMPGGGSIRVSAVPQRDTVLIMFRDTGPGIAPEIRDRLFQPFATARKPNGLGLGLAISRQALLDHGGDMWAESSRQGACFAVRLPVLPHSAVSC